MSNEADGSGKTPRRKEPFPWFKFRVARVLSEPGVMAVWSNSAALAAMMRLAVYSWGSGPIPDAALDAVCGDRGAADLLRAVLLRRDESGNWTLPWLEAERAEAVKVSSEQALRRRSFHQRSTSGEPVVDQRTTNRQDKTRGEKKREEKTGGTPPKSPPLADARLGSEKASRGGTEVTRWWDSEFLRTHGTAYVWVRTGKDGRGCPDAIVLGQLQKQGRPVDEIKERITTFLERGFESGNTWEIENATPTVFVKRYGVLGTQVKKLTATERKLAELQSYATAPKEDPFTP